MSRHSLAILTDGMLSDSQKRTLTLLSLGWIADALVYVPEEEEEKKKVRVWNLPDTKPKPIDNKDKQLKDEDEYIYSIISTFIQCQNLELA